MMRTPRRGSGHSGREARPRQALPAVLLVLAAVAQGLSPPTAPAAPTTTAALPAGAVTTPAPPTIRHRLHVSAPPIAARTTATPPWSAAAATRRTSPTSAARATASAGRAWPSPTATSSAASASTATTLRPPTVGSRPAAAEASNTTAPTADPAASSASQAERPSAAAATSATATATVTANARAAEEEQYPMYAEYPDTSANITSGSGPDSAEGDVVPDPDAALRQDAVDEAEERERASLADDGPAPVEAAEAHLVAVARGGGGVISEDPGVDVVFGPVADLPGVLDAGFERAPGGVVPGENVLDLPVEPAADQDLREHDRLDGDVYRERAELMLRNQGAAGKQVVIVGAALALVAQFLCLASATRRLRPGHVDVSTAVLFNVEFALIVENLVFMLGVQSVGEPLRCQWVALALHYLHLVAAGWFLANTAFLAYRLRCNAAAPAAFRPVAAAVWLLPAVLVSAMYAAQPRSYETHRYCWMAVQRGMLLTFVAPVTLMMTVNTALTLRGLRARPVPEDADKDLAVDTEAAGGGQDGAQDGDAVRERDAATPAELRSSLRAAAAMLPLYSADWFLGVVAMDNSTFLTYPLLFLVSNGFLNWFLMVCAWLVVPRESHKEGGDWCGGGDGDDLDDEDELLLEEEDAGCWGKGSGYGSAYGSAYGVHGEEQALIWAANAALERSGAVSAEPRVHIRAPRPSPGSRWDESAAAFLRDGDVLGDVLAAAAPSTASGTVSTLSQELAEMRYDGGISTISS